MGVFRRSGEKPLVKNPFSLRSRPSILPATGQEWESQGGDPDGVAGWGGGLYFSGTGGILIIRRAPSGKKGFCLLAFNPYFLVVGLGG